MACAKSIGFGTRSLCHSMAANGAQISQEMVSYQDLSVLFEMNSCEGLAQLSYQSAPSQERLPSQLPDLVTTTQRSFHSNFHVVQKA
jgi:hypothetical protein